MKPLNLKISAFGPYKNITKIDFKKLGENGLFLVTGDTGAGKTTIYDAISYALFNEVSGSNRPISSLRSNFATIEDTFVELEFEHKNKIYKVRRIPEYERKKKSGEGTTKNMADASLEFDDKVITGIKNVNEKIIELIGINAKQFKQIAMLAQGEFIKILFAESKDRTEIFRKIFETGVYELISNKLNDLSSNLKKNVESLKTSFQTNVDNIRWYEKPVSLDLIEFKKIVKNDIEEVLVKIDEDIEKNKEIFIKSEKENEKLKKEKKSLEEKIQNLKEQNEKIEKYQNYIETDRILNEQESAFKDKEKKIKASQEALQKILPIEEIVSSIKNELKDANTKKENLDDTIIREEKLEAENKIKTVKLVELKKILELYKELKDKQNKNNDINKIIREINNSNEEKEKYVENYNIVNKKYTDKDKEYKIEEDKFFREQAGILAERLEEGMPCPVCGSIEHPDKAIKRKNVLTEAEMKQLKEEIKILENQNNNIKEKVTSLKSKIETLIGSIPESKEKTFELNKYIEMIKEEKEKFESEANELKNEYNDICYELGSSGYDIEEINFDIYREEIEDRIKNDNERLVENKTLLKETKKLIEEKNKLLLNKQKEYNNVIVSLGYKDEHDYKENILDADKIEKYIKEIEKYTAEKVTNKTRINDLEKELKSKEIVNIEEDVNNLEIITDEQRNKEEIANGIKAKIDFNKDTNKKLKETAVNLIAEMDKTAKVDELAKLANGTANKKTKITFEQYVQATYFDMVINEANKRLISMTDSRYELVRKKKADRISEKIGLDLNVLDNYNGQERDVKSLSGGESFKAALSLALGLSDVIQSYSGGVVIDTLFIDEGFGTLDAESREQAINTLLSLTGNNKLIGIISHVEELKERIDKKIIVKKGQDGSDIEIQF